MSESGSFLSPWLRDLGAAVALLSALLAALKAAFGERPFVTLEPMDPMFGTSWRLQVVNPTKVPILLTRASNHSGARVHVGSGADTSKAAVHTAVTGRLDVVVDAEGSHELRFTCEDDPSPVLVVLRWQRLGGLPWPRVPLVIWRSKSQMARLQSVTNIKSDFD